MGELDLAVKWLYSPQPYPESDSLSMFTINIKGARAILVKKSDLPGFDQKHYNTTYSDLSRNTTIRLISQKAQEGYFALTVEILRLDFTTILHFDFGILQFKRSFARPLSYHKC